MTTITFPLGVAAGLQMSLENAVNLADRLVGAMQSDIQPEYPFGLDAVLSQSGIPFDLRSTAVQQAALGHSLRHAFTALAGADTTRLGPPIFQDLVLELERAYAENPLQEEGWDEYVSAANLEGLCRDLASSDERSVRAAMKFVSIHLGRLSLDEDQMQDFAQFLFTGDVLRNLMRVFRTALWWEGGRELFVELRLPDRHGAILARALVSGLTQVLLGQMDDHEPYCALALYMIRRPIFQEAAGDDAKRLVGTLCDLYVEGEISAFIKHFILNANGLEGSDLELRLIGQLHRRLSSLNSPKLNDLVEAVDRSVRVRCLEDDVDIRKLVQTHLNRGLRAADADTLRGHLLYFGELLRQHPDIDFEIP
jgi:hypothetical protein